jgi:hypothetical protein
MITKIKSITFVFLAMLFVLSSCKQEEYSFGDITTPSDLTLTTVVTGADAANPAGNGTGSVVITTKAAHAITYKVDFGDGNSKMVSSGAITYKYTNPGTYNYIVTVNAVGTAGTTSTTSKKISVFVAFEIPKTILDALTNGSSKKWTTANETPGHFGVGPADGFSPIWYAATPNQRDPLAYDDEITFSKDALNNVSMNVDNKGASFLTGAATAFYGFSGGDGTYPLNTGGTKKLAFMDATSTSTSSNSTRIQFVVPGNGIINFGTGGTTYEILSITSSSLQLRNIGADGNAWYQILKAK